MKPRKQLCNRRLHPYTSYRSLCLGIIDRKSHWSDLSIRSDKISSTVESGNGTTFLNKRIVDFTLHSCHI